jgi:hypothetical protein
VKVGHINITKKKYAIYVHEQEKETHLDSGYKSVIALCRAVISSLDDGDDVQKPKDENKNQNSSRPAVTSIIFSVHRLVYDAGFSLEMRNSRTIRALYSHCVLGCIVSTDAPICCRVDMIIVHSVSAGRQQEFR